MRNFGDHEPKVVKQLVRCLAPEEGSRGALCADGHLGYSAPIGGVMAYREHVSPSGVGYDIGCGNKAVLTDLRADEVRADLAGLMDRIFSEVSFGMGRRNPEPIDHPVLDEIRTAAFAPQRQLHDLAAKQLGTVGAGNHYVDLFADEEGRVWIGVHFGSRGFGHKTASGFLSLAAGGRFDERGRGGEMEAPPTLLAIDSEIGQAYIDAMRLAGAYAYAGRDVVVEKALAILGAKALDEVHNHHNFAWPEAHGGEDYWVVRKGATPARPGQRGFVGSTMGEDSVILEGVESDAERVRALLHRPRRRPRDEPQRRRGQEPQAVGVPEPRLRLDPGAAHPQAGERPVPRRAGPARQAVGQGDRGRDRLARHDGRPPRARHRAPRRRGRRGARGVQAPQRGPRASRGNRARPAHPDAARRRDGRRRHLRPLQGLN